MYTPATIQSQIQGTSSPLVGWRREYDPVIGNLDVDLFTSASGRFFQDIHPALTLKNVMSTGPRVEDFVYPTYSATSDYNSGEAVTFGETSYRCIQSYTIADDGAQSPDAASSQYWQVYTTGARKSDWLRDKVQGYLLAVIDDWMTYNKMKGATKSLIEERALFDGTSSTGELTEQRGKTVGIEIDLTRHFSIKATINKIGLMFDRAGTVNVSLYHSSLPTAIQTQALVYTTANKQQFFDLGWDLKYLETNFVGGTFRIEYDQGDMIGLNTTKDWKYRATSRQGYNYNSWKLWGKYLVANPFWVEQSNKGNLETFNREHIDNYGLNLLISVYCDFTDLIIRQKSVFQNAIIKGIGVRLLKDIVYNPYGRVNLNESNLNVSKAELLFDIDGDPTGRPTGIAKEYHEALKAAILDTSGVDGACLKCVKKKIKIGSMTR